MDHIVIVSDNAAMDRVLQEERAYIPEHCKSDKKICGIAGPEHFVNADLVEEVANVSTKFVKVNGIQNQSKIISIVVRVLNKFVLEEADRSLHDVLCVIRYLVKKRAQITGGGAPEI